MTKMTLKKFNVYEFVTLKQSEFEALPESQIGVKQS